MAPLPFAWPTWIPFWLLYLWAFAPELGIVKRGDAAAARPGSVDAGSLRRLLVLQMAGLAAAFALAFAPFGRLPARAQLPAFWAGLALLASGSLLRRHCWKVLGASFTGDVQVRSGQAIVTRGAYAWVRHPAYSGGLLMFLGIATALGSWAGLLAMGLAAFTAYHQRMVVEEAALLAELGDEYRRFLATRKRIIPFLY